MAEEFTSRLRTAFADDLDAVVLYGSVARDESGRESDIDVLVLTGDASYDAWSRIYHIGYELGDAEVWEHISPFVVSPTKLEGLATDGFPIARNVFREGIVLYDKGTFRKIKELSESRPQSNRGFIEYQLREAQRMLDEASLLLNASYWGGGADRAYYAMFHAGQAALAVAGAEPPHTHSGMHATFSQLLIHTGRIEGEFSQLSQAFELRQAGTYGGENVPELTEAQATELMQKARRFVERMRRFVDEAGPL